MSPKITIIDCGVGNHQSVRNALKMIGHAAVISSDPQEISSASHLIIPGVGSFAEGMDGIRKRNLGQLLTEEVLHKRKPILGICLGMQLFATEGREHGVHRGLGWIEGTVEGIDASRSHMRLPHIGWNDVTMRQKHPIVNDCADTSSYYFVHSFHVRPVDSRCIVGVSDYGVPVTAIVAQDNIVGVQFHPEKSHEDGLKIFRNFLALSC